MGFKFKRVDLLAGSESFQVGSGYEYQRIRSEKILTHVVDALIGMNIGWQLDTDRNTTSSDYNNVPCATGTNTFPGIFLKNSISNCKMFLACFGGSFANSDVIKNFNNNSTFKYSTNSQCSGIICSIIPSESSSEFGDFDDSFLPPEATRLVGTSQGTSNSTSVYMSHAYNPHENYWYSYGIFATPYALAISASNSSNPSTKPHLPSAIYVTGRIISELAHEEDNAVNAKYGFFLNHRPTGNESGNEGWGRDYAYSTSFMGFTLHLPGASITDGSASYQYCGGCISNANGDWINGTDSSQYTVKYVTTNPYLLSGNLYSKNTTTRWCPLCIFVQSNNLNTYGVVPGDGLKGIIDPELARASRGEMGTVFDNGNFIQADEPAYRDISFGWSPENTESILPISV